MNNLLSHRYFYVLLVTVLTLLCFGGAVNNDLSLDDEFVINERTEGGLKNIDLLAKSRYYTIDNESFDYRPVVMISFALEHELFGRSNVASHLINLLLYIFVCMAVYHYLRSLFADKKLIIYAALVLFIMHPLHSEVVLSLKNRDELLAALFGFLACNIFLNIKDYSIKSWLKWASILIFLLLSLFSKKTGFAFIGISFLSALYKSSLQSASLKSLPFVITLIASKFVNASVIKNRSERGFYYYENPLYLETINFLGRVPVAIDITFNYIILFFVPYPLRFYYGHPLIDIANWQDIRIWFYLATIIPVGYYAIKSWRQKKAVGFGIVFFASTSLLYSNLFKPAVGIMAERFMFVPILGLCIAVAYAINWIHVHYPQYNFGKYALIVFAIFTALYNTKRTQDWENQLSLFEADISHLEHSAKANFLYAYELQKQNSFKNSKAQQLKAAKHYYLAVLGYKDYKEAHNNNGWLHLIHLNKPIHAKKMFQESIRSDSNYAHPYHGLGTFFDSRGQFDSAVYYYRKAYIKSKKEMLATAKFKEFLIYQKQQNGAALIQVGHELIADGVLMAQTYNFIGNGHNSLSNIDSALYYYDKAYNIEPNDEQAKIIYELAIHSGNISLQKKYGILLR